MANERSEHIQVVTALRAVAVRTKGAVRHFHVPNGERRDEKAARILKSLGVMPGVPDLLIVGRPQTAAQPLSREDLAAIRAAVADETPESLIPRLLATIDAARGVALEMKRADGRLSDVGVEQREWLVFLRSLGWDALVGYGALDALRKIKALGYPVQVSDGPVRE